MRYFKGSIFDGLLIKPASSLQLTAFSDTNWVTNLDNRKSVSSYVVMRGKTLVSWSSKKQATVSRSSTEAEYHSLASATSNIMWIRNLFLELKILLQQPDLLWCDN